MNRRETNACSKEAVFVRVLGWLSQTI